MEIQTHDILLTFDNGTTHALQMKGTLTPTITVPWQPPGEAQYHGPDSPIVFKPYLKLLFEFAYTSDGVHHYNEVNGKSGLDFEWPDEI